METAYDWISVIIFAGLATLFLQRSMMERTVDRIWQYVPPALGCAAGNQFGNSGWHFPAILLLGGSVVYVFYVLKPGRMPG